MHHQEWFSKGHLTADMVWKHPSGRNYGKRYLPETVGRALRHLEENSIIAVRDGGASVDYRWIPKEHRSRYIPSSARVDGSKHIIWKPKFNQNYGT